MDPHAPDAVAKLPNLELQINVERALCLWACEDLGESEWADEVRQADDPRSTKGRFMVLRDDPQRLALVVMLSGQRHHPRAWVDGVKAALGQWPSAKRAVQDVMRVGGEAPSMSESDESFAWKL